MSQVRRVWEFQTQILSQVSNLPFLNCLLDFFCLISHRQSGWLGKETSSSDLNEILSEEAEQTQEFSHNFSRSTAKTFIELQTRLESLFIPIMAYSLHLPPSTACFQSSATRPSVSANPSSAIEVESSLCCIAGSAAALDMLNVECIISLILSCSFFPHFTGVKKKYSNGSCRKSLEQCSADSRDYNGLEEKKVWKMRSFFISNFQINLLTRSAVFPRISDNFAGFALGKWVTDWGKVAWTLIIWWAKHE